MKILSILIILLGISCSTQKVVETNLVETNIQSNFAGMIYTDKFDNIYTLDVAHEITLYNDDYSVSHQYANSLNGDITHIDVTNPQRILAYIREYGTIILLDNTLSELATINLPQMGYTDISMACNSNDGNFWLYDEANMRLLKTDKNGKIIAESNSLYDYNLPLSSPVYMIEQDNKVFVSTEGGLLLIFDNFGQYEKSLPMKTFPKFNYRNRSINYLENGNIVFYDLTLFEVVALEIKQRDLQVIDFAITEKGIVLLTNNGVQKLRTQRK